MTETTVNADEIAKFSAMADDWWDPDGDFKPLHKFNPVRLGYIRDWALNHFRRSETERRPLDGLTVLDIGCGGGLLTEPLTRLGATVTGIDAGQKNIAVAKLHAERAGLVFSFRVSLSVVLVVVGARC